MKIVSIVPRSGQRNQTQNQSCQTLTCHPSFSHSHQHKFQLSHLCQSLTCHLSCRCKFPLFHLQPSFGRQRKFPLFYLQPSFSHWCKFPLLFPLFHLQPSFSRRCKFLLFQFRLRFQVSQILLGHSLQPHIQTSI